LLHNVKNIAGMSMKGGRNDKFFFCLMEYYEDENRWFLKSLLQVKDQEEKQGDDAIHDWIKESDLKGLVVDFPLSSPFCQTCTLRCPGIENCSVEGVRSVFNVMDAILEEDRNFQSERPKDYERKRNLDDQIRGSLNKIMISRSFKRRIKKGFLPYWNRAIDLWIWINYYDSLLETFGMSYDSFGSTSLMVQSRFSYLKRHFPQDLELYEGNGKIILLELLRAKILKKDDILKIKDIEGVVDGRVEILKKLEAALNIFIYDSDLEVLAKNPPAFDSFLLALLGRNIHFNKIREIPSWAMNNASQFVAPSFL
jgi:hypothetical protein